MITIITYNNTFTIIIECTFIFRVDQCVSSFSILKIGTEQHCGIYKILHFNGLILLRLRYNFTF